MKNEAWKQYPDADILAREIAEFAEDLNQRQLRWLRCYYSKKRKCYVAPSEPTIRRILVPVPSAEFEEAVTAWMAEQDGPMGRATADR